MSKKIAIIDYSLGNIYSVQQALSYFGANTIVTHDQKEIKDADAIVLPGVGAFAEAMSNLREMNLVNAIKNVVNEGKPFMGICLGLQLLFDSSDEFGNTEGLGLIKGKIKKFSFTDNRLKVPQMGWNTITEPSTDRWRNSPLQSIKKNEFMYFVHSYYAIADNEVDKLCETEYGGITYCSAVLKNNIFAVQFHPEKSAGEGLKIYKNWLERI